MQVNITQPYKYPLFFIATAGVAMVIHMASKICAMVKEHAVLMLPIATSEVHVGLMGRQVSYNCKRKLYFIQTLLQSILQLCDFEY